LFSNINHPISLYQKSQLFADFFDTLDIRRTGGYFPNHY